jgi:hypothetical protein
MKPLPIFSAFLVGFEQKFGTDTHNKVLCDCGFHENRHSGCHTLLRGFNKRLLHTFHIYCPICTPFDIKVLRIILFSLFEFRENWRWEGRTFVMGVN